jgi:histidyl-tRNA synthetase
MANKSSTKPASGMRDFLPADVARRRHVIAIIREVYEAHGFVPLETPTIENLSTLLGKYGDEGDQLLYRVLHRRDALKRPIDKAAAEGRPVTEAELADKGLRYDLTVPLARVVAQYGDLPRFFKRYQIQPVWRADRPGKGRYREFYQCDVDVTGTRSMMADAEVCGAVAKVLSRLGFEDFCIRLNHRELLRAMIRAAGIADELEATALVAVDKLDKIGTSGVLDELEGRGISARAGGRLLELVNLGERELGNAGLLDSLSAAVDDRGRAAVEELRELLSLLSDGPAAAHTRVHPDLARGLSYYTGPIFEISVPDLKGSMGGGGRYDDLVGMFGKKQVPAVGFSLGLERILVVMEERGMYPDLEVGADLLLCWKDVEPRTVLSVARRLRDQGVRVEVFPESAKMEKQLRYAGAAGVAVAGILGPKELEADELQLKDQRTREQRAMSIDEITPATLGKSAPSQ